MQSIKQGNALTEKFSSISTRITRQGAGKGSSSLGTNSKAMPKTKFNTCQ